MINPKVVHQSKTVCSNNLNTICIPDNVDKVTIIFTDENGTIDLYPFNSAKELEKTIQNGLTYLAMAECVESLKP